MDIPKVLRKQLQAYVRAGFLPVRVESREGSHFKVWFREFSEPQFLTKNAHDPRAIKNNICRFRRLAAER